MNTTSQQQKADFVEHDEEKIPELIDHDTGMNGEINTEHTFNTMMNWKPFQKKTMKNHQ